MGKVLYVLGGAAFLAAAVAIFYFTSEIGERPRAPAVAKAPQPAPAPAKPEPKPEPATVEVLFESSDGKKEWVEDVVKAFNARKVVVGGKPVVVKLKHIRGGESRLAILAGKEKPTIWGPAGHSWVELINGDWNEREHKPFLTDVHDTVRTALVIATWEPMARALGWPAKAIGWADLQRVALDPRGWGAFGHPEWGPFRFGHSHPDYSNSAALSFLSLIYAAAGKTSGLTLEDLQKPHVVTAVTALERTIVHYGESSSWLTEKLCTRGPAYLSAVTVYESSVVKANDKFKLKLHRLVALYPKEGTFWETHPVGIVNADWVTPEQREGARLLIDFLLTPEQQAKAPRFGFRPALEQVPLTAPFDEEHGIDPKAARKELAYVGDDVFKGANKLWHQVKKKAAVWLVVDTSGSMDAVTLDAVKRGTISFLRQMEPEDLVRVISFSTDVHPQGEAGLRREVGEDLVARINALHADGQTRLYDAVFTALKELEKIRKQRTEGRQYGVVLLATGADRNSDLRREQLIEVLAKATDAQGTRVFTIGYGNSADEELLRDLSERSNGVMVKGSAADLDKVYHQLASYF